MDLYYTSASGNSNTGVIYDENGVTQEQEMSASRKFIEENMSTLFYSVGGTLIVLSFVIHGCLFYRRWRLKRRRASPTKDVERGSSWIKAPGRETTDEIATVSTNENNQTDPTSSVSVEPQKLPTKSSPSKSLLDQDLNERRRSSTRIKVLPPRELSRSFSGPAQLPQQKTENDHAHESIDDKSPTLKESFANKLLERLSKEDTKATSLGRTEPQQKPNRTEKICTLPGNETCSDYEMIKFGNESDVTISTANTPVNVIVVPAILKTPPSDENNAAYDVLNHGLLTTKSGVNFRNTDKPQQNRFKRRSYSFDHIPVLEISVQEEEFWNRSQTVAPGRSRSASETRRPSLKSRQTKPKKAVESSKSVSNTSPSDPMYFTLVPDSELEPKHGMRYRTLPPVRSSKTTKDPSSPKKKKFSLKFMRNSEKSQKKKNKKQTPPCSPVRNANQREQSIIYEEPEILSEPNPATSPVYFTLDPNEEKKAIDCCEENIISNETKSSSKSKSFISFPRNRIKSKSTKTIPTFKNYPDPESSQNADNEYEVLEIPKENPKMTEAAVYDSLEPGLPLASATAPKNSAPVIGRTNTGAPLRQFQPARRELPSRPSVNVYDCIERGNFLSPGAHPRSQSLRPNTRRGSSPSTQRLNSNSSTTYDTLSPLTLPDQLEASSLRRGSSPESSRRLMDGEYDLLNPDTFTRPNAAGSEKGLRPGPEVSPKPRSRQLLRNANITHDPLNQAIQYRRGSLGARHGTGFKPILRTSSMSKIKRAYPDILPKPHLKQQGLKDAKPSVPPRKPSLNGDANTIKTADSNENTDPVYFTLDPNTNLEPI